MVRGRSLGSVGGIGGSGDGSASTRETPVVYGTARVYDGLGSANRGNAEGRKDVDAVWFPDFDGVWKTGRNVEGDGAISDVVAEMWSGWEWMFVGGGAE